MRVVKASNSKKTPTKRGVTGANKKEAREVQVQKKVDFELKEKKKINKQKKRLKKRKPDITRTFVLHEKLVTKGYFGD